MVNISASKWRQRHNRWQGPQPDCMPCGLWASRVIPFVLRADVRALLTLAGSSTNHQRLSASSPLARHLYGKSGGENWQRIRLRGLKHLPPFVSLTKLYLKPHRSMQRHQSASTDLLAEDEITCNHTIMGQTW